MWYGKRWEKRRKECVGVEMVGGRPRSSEGTIEDDRIFEWRDGGVLKGAVRSDGVEVI
jgi:hypothetical protein